MTYTWECTPWTAESMTDTNPNPAKMAKRDGGHKLATSDYASPKPIHLRLRQCLYYKRTRNNRETSGQIGYMVQNGIHANTHCWSTPYENLCHELKWPTVATLHHKFKDINRILVFAYIQMYKICHHLHIDCINFNHATL